MVSSTNPFAKAETIAQDFVGIGIYTAPEAARLTGVPTARVRRWLNGYTYRRGDETRRSKAVWQGQLPRLDNVLALGFLDLVELHFVDSFLRAGVSLATVRKTAEIASERLDTEHPFSTRRFRTDGKTIFEQLQGEGGDPGLYDLVRNQFGFYDIILPSLDEFEFDPAGQAKAWRPYRPTPRILLDPARQFGQPIVAGTGVRTAALFDAVKAEGSIERVASWFDLDADDVQQAVDFEVRRAA